MENEKQKAVLSGNQAIARGFYEAGGRIAASYPGSPTVEVLAAIKEYEDNDIYAEFSTNEKVALEVAMGGSFAGARSLCVMKHVGVNIAADPLFTFTQTTVNGGFVLVSGDDPGLSSSQNEQDSRLLGKFGHMAIFDPSDSQEAKDFTKLAFETSEAYHMPVMLRTTSRLCHSRGVVTLEDRKAVSNHPFEPDPSKYTMLPPHANRAQHTMKERIEKLTQQANDWDINILETTDDASYLIVTSGLMYQHVRELNAKADVLKLGMVYPLPIEKIKGLATKYDKIVVIEEMMPFIENELKLAGVGCVGKEHFSFTGELDIKDVALGLNEAGVACDVSVLEFNAAPVEVNAVPRSPMMCAGCPHRPVFDMLKKARVQVVGDIGCYSLGILYPFEVLNINISMGSSLGIAKGMRKVLNQEGSDQPVVAVIGDGTFFHSGMTGTVNLLHQLDEEKENITILILDNSTTAMTGGQPTASSGLYNKDDDMSVDIEALLRTLGFNRVSRVDQFEYKKSAEALKAEFKHPGLSFVITTRPCALKFKINEPHFYVDTDTCIGCRTCVKTNCPPIKMTPEDKSSINTDMCVGCSICAQVCPVQAIKSSANKAEAKKA